MRDNPRVARPLVAFLVVLTLAFAACGYGDDSDSDDDRLIGPRGETDTVEFEDLVVEVPEDWDSTTTADDSTLLLANFELESDSQPPRQFGQDEVLISIAMRLPCQPSNPPRGLPVVVQALDLESTPGGHSAACYVFLLEGEFLEDEPAYELSAEFGSESPPPALLDEVNDVLATLQQN